MISVKKFEVLSMCICFVKTVLNLYFSLTVYASVINIISYGIQCFKNCNFSPFVLCYVLIYNLCVFIPSVVRLM